LRRERQEAERPSAFLKSFVVASYCLHSVFATSVVKNWI